MKEQVDDLMVIFIIEEIIVFFIFIIFIGISLNFVAVKNNNYKMPVKLDYNFSDENHQSFSNFSEVKYPLLVDILNIGGYYFSFGDLMLFIGSINLIIFTFYQQVLIIKYKRKYKKDERWKNLFFMQEIS